ncbi:MAG: hypothetical protein ABI591_01435 [Kofleriaceae bacterium]
MGHTGEQQRQGPAGHHDVPKAAPTGDAINPLFANGAPTVEAVATAISTHPAQRNAIISALQQWMGNGFVQQVIVALAARPPGAVPGATATDRLKLHPDNQTKAAALVQDNGTALDKARRLADVSGSHLTSVSSSLIPAYRAARDQIDLQGVTELGSSLVAALDLSRATTSALEDQLALVKPHNSAGGDAEVEMAEAGQLATLQPRLNEIKKQLKTVELAVLTTLTPTMFRGAQVAGEAVAVTMHDEAALDPQLQDELARTVMMIAFVDRATLQIAKHKARPADAARDARFEMSMNFHRPLDVAFLRAAFSARGLWEQLNLADPLMPMLAEKKPLFGMETCSDEGPATDLAKGSAAQAKRTGWLTDVGTFDTDLVRVEIRMNNTEAAMTVYSMISSSPSESRVKLLEQLDREGLLDMWLAKLPWHYVKELHDSYGGEGTGPTKHKLQKYFLTPGKWGTDLGAEQYHAPSLTKAIRSGGEHLGSIGSHIVNGIDDVLNVATLGFHHSYGDARDAHSEGLVTDEEYEKNVRQICTRTTVGMAMMMATGGIGELMPGAAAGTSTARTIINAGVEAGTFATSETMAMDATDVATGAKDHMGDALDYLKTYAMGGGMGAAMGGATAALSGRTASRYLSRTELTRGQRLAVENPALAPVLDQVAATSKGAIAEIRINAFSIDGLERRGIIDAASAQKLRQVTADGSTARATVRVTDELNKPGLVGDGASFEVTSATPEPAPKSVKIGGEHDGPAPDEPHASPAPKEGSWHSKDLTFVKDTNEIDATAENYAKPVGRVLRTASEGHDLLDKLAVGDKSALKTLGVKVRWGFKRTELEWMLVETQDGYVIVAGGQFKTTFHGKILGHTHPSIQRDGSPALLADSEGRTKNVERHFDEIETDPQRKSNALSAGLIPSAADVEATLGGEQVLHTRFVEGPNGGVVNPGTAGAGEQINITISEVRKLKPLAGQNALDSFYEARFTARASGKPNPMWTQKAYVQRSPYGDAVSFQPTNAMKKMLEQP